MLFFKKSLLSWLLAFVLTSTGCAPFPETEETSQTQGTIVIEGTLGTIGIISLLALGWVVWDESSPYGLKLVTKSTNGLAIGFASAWNGVVDSAINTSEKIPTKEQIAKKVNLPELNLNSLKDLFLKSPLKFSDETLVRIVGTVNSFLGDVKMLQPD